MFVVINYIPIARNCLPACINSQRGVAGIGMLWYWGAFIHTESCHCGLTVALQVQSRGTEAKAPVDRGTGLQGGTAVTVTAAGCTAKYQKVMSGNTAGSQSQSLLLSCAQLCRE